MDLNEYLETIVEFNTDKPYGIIIAQVVFDSFRKYCIDYIESPNKILFDSLYSLVQEYTDEPFKKYIDILFQDTHFEQFETRDLCLEFFKKFISYIDSILDGDTLNETIITDFLDHNIYKYFEIILSDNLAYLFFPKTFEDDLNIELFETLQTTLTDPPKIMDTVALDTPIEQIEETHVKSFMRAIVKNKHKHTKKHISFKSRLNTRKLKTKG